MNKPKILYLDDERGNLDNFYSLFRREYEVILTETAEEAWEQLTIHHDIQVILTDQRMPRVTGVEFLEKIDNSHNDAVRILVTGYADMNAIIDSINRGKIHYYISKPWKVEDISFKIQQSCAIYQLRRDNKELTKEKERLIVEGERKEKEKLITQLQVLKNQIDPHFLFNSLNTLHALVAEVPVARKFIQKLSVTYRYLLEHNFENIVTLEEELKFVDGYIYLLEQRFSTGFLVNIEIKPKDFQRMMPSAALQMVIENAIKHNVISDSMPLKVDIYIEEDYLVVKNNLQLRMNSVDSTGIGQRNLMERCRILTGKEPLFLGGKNHYFSKIPLIVD